MTKKYQPIPILNPPPQITGKTQLLLNHGRLWPDLKADASVDLSDVDFMASALEYLELWRTECQERFPLIQFVAVLEPGERMAEVFPDDFLADSTKIIRSCLRLGMQLYARHDVWLVREDSERQAYWVERFGVSITDFTRRKAPDTTQHRSLIHASGRPPVPAAGHGVWDE